MVTFHVYRGVLGFEGQEMYNMWLSCTQKLLDKGFISKVDFDSVYYTLQEDIQSVG